MKARETRFMLGAVLSLALLTGPFGTVTAHALDVHYLCRADADAVFGIASVTAQRMRGWRSIRIMASERTIRAVVRNGRNLSVPIWIQARAAGKSDEAVSELHVLWEQTMDPLNYPDLFAFTETFLAQQESLGMGCALAGTERGL